MFIKEKQSKNVQHRKSRETFPEPAKGSLVGTRRSWCKWQWYRLLMANPSASGLNGPRLIVLVTLGCHNGLSLYMWSNDDWWWWLSRDLSLKWNSIKVKISVRFKVKMSPQNPQATDKSLIFRLDALALSVIATATWLGGWLGVCHSRYCIKTTKPIWKLFGPSGSPII